MGTTYSKVAYTFTDKSHETRVIENWPGAGGVKYRSCPTILKYEDDGTIKWGHQIDRYTDGCIEAFKLQLDPKSAQPLYRAVVDNTALLKKLRKKPRDLVSDFLWKISEHVLETLSSRFLEGGFDEYKKVFVLTIPAAWSESVTEQFLEVKYPGTLTICTHTLTFVQAALDAGINPAKMIKEPEAAALYTMEELGRSGLSVGDAFVVCDAGGGTVDLASYEVVMTGPLKTKQLVPPSGMYTEEISGL